jgi:hypothetical protein
MQFFTELPHCPPLVRFVFEVTEAAHTFSSYNYSRAMTAADLDGALSKCVSCQGRFVESAAFDADGGPDVFFAQSVMVFSNPRARFIVPNVLV